MNKSFYIIIFFLLSSIVYSQITGIVKDDKGVLLPNVNIILLDSIQEIEAFAISDKNGEFKIDDFLLGNKTIQIKRATFQTIEEDLIIDRKSIDLGEFVLIKEDAIALKEVIVKAEYNPYKKDTAEFDASKYRTGKEMNVEDLIKNIPGATVDKDGRIKIGKKEVQSVLVEGDDLFNNGYSILTQAMNDQSVAKIQVINNHTKNKLTKDIYDTDALAINLILDDKAKNKWNGSATLASTSYVENRHQVRLNLMNFSKKRKFVSIFNYNTIGFDEMKGVNYLIKNQFTSAYNFDLIGTNNTLPNLVNLYQDNYLFEDNRTNFNNDKIGVINAINNFKSSKLHILGLYNRIEKNNYIDEIESYNDNTIQFTNTQKSHWNKKIDNYFTKVEWNKELNSTSNFTIVNRSYYLKEINENTFLFNSNDISLKGNNATTSLETQGIYTNKIDSARLITVVAKHLFENRPYQFVESNPIFGEVYSDSQISHLNQEIDNKQNYLGLKGTYFHKLSDKENYYFTIGSEYQNIDLNSEFFGLNEDFSSQIALDNAKNDLSFRQFKVFLEPAYLKEWKAFRLNLKLPIEYFSTSIANDLDDKSNRLTLSPKVDFSYEKRKFGKIALGYTYRVIPTSFEVYYQEMIYKGNRQFAKSNLSTYQLFGGSQVNLNYSRSKSLNNGIDFNLIYQIQDKNVGYNSIFQPNFSINNNVLVEGSEMWMPSVSYKYFWIPIKSKIQINTSYTSVKSSSIVNENSIRNHFNSYTIGLEMKSGYSGIWNYELGGKFSFNKNKNQFNSNDFRNIDAYANVYFNLSKQTTLDVSYEFYNFGGQNQSSTNFLDLRLYHKIPNSKMKLFVLANNLLNNKSINRNMITPISERFYTQRLLPLHILLGFNFNF
ncbi:peptidase associated/transthyretin-like domain-containing protein [Faecalibacter macacae]|uniref:Carboxypeptidase regulatory-like domain-containing protein n=1 Tax=Faecalibacter macacae TaxID=1859289 RepID=A0A3L9MIY7_9FLAO|nr:carboxypeptidase-like regulatory domain-containing protein [Faecalibacter macacae]RLZ12801.1 carboxypeptidase regulatory-like domain-containing protein [Faecalibacter macacae]